MKLIVGLGNPGEKYQKTRHNLGFLVLDQLFQQTDFHHWRLNKKAEALTAEKISRGQKIILAKPQTYMNNSGRAVKALTNYYKLPSQDILIVHDDIDLPLGQIKIQKGRGSAGHKGVQSIIESLNTKDFIRLRIGIRSLDKENIETEKFVLEKFSPDEQKIVKETIKKAAQIILAAVAVTES